VLFFVTLPTGAILYARVILCELLSICRSKILASEWVFSKIFPLNPPWKWEHRLAFKPASRIRFYSRRNFAAATVNYWQNTVKKKEVIFEKGLFNNFKRENTLFFLKNLLANSSFLIFPKFFSPKFRSFWYYNIGWMLARYTLCAHCTWAT
jgi:hypothetical protein